MTPAPSRRIVLISTLTAAALLAALTAAAMHREPSRAAAPAGHHHMEVEDPAFYADPRCGEAHAMRNTTGLVQCAHADEPPAGVDVRHLPSTSVLQKRKGAAANAVAVAAVHRVVTAKSDAGGAVLCDGDGRSGYRTQAMYVVEAGKPNRYDSLLASLNTWARGVDAVVSRSAAVTGGARNVRWVTVSSTDGSCTLDIANVTVPAGSLSSFSSQNNAVAALGYNDPTRKYLMWTDTSVLCGIATTYPYSMPAQTNPNNGSYVQYARIDAPCWGAPQPVEAHELVHTLGSVMPDAPHATRNGHCWDESDRMCYDDGSGVAMRNVCPAEKEVLLDCNSDDYFNTSPADGSYLATHWNTANSRFLIGGGTSSPTPVKLSVSVVPSGAAVRGLPLPVSLAVTLPSGSSVTSTALRASDVACVVAKNGDNFSVTCPASASTSTITVTATVTAATSASASTTATSTRTITFDTTRRTPAVALSLAGHDAGSPVCTGSISGAMVVTDASSGNPVYGLGASASLLLAGATKASKAATTTIAGSASWSGSVLPGEQYQVSTTALGPWQQTTASSTLDVAACAPQITASAVPAQAMYSDVLTVSGTFAGNRGTTVAWPGQSVAVASLTGRANYTQVGTAVVKPDGTWSASLTLTGNLNLFAFSPLAPSVYVPVGAVTTQSWTPAASAPTLVRTTATRPTWNMTGTITESYGERSAAMTGISATVWLVGTDGVTRRLASITTGVKGTYSASFTSTVGGQLRLEVRAGSGLSASMMDLGTLTI